MNIQNLNADELKQLQSLQSLLNKLNLQPVEQVIDPVNKMIDDIMDNFEWEETQRVMEFMEWKWAGEGVPTVESMKKTAKRLLRNAADARLNEFEHEHWEQGIINSTGGFEATAYCNHAKNKITKLDLKFILNQWGKSIKD